MIWQRSLRMSILIGLLVLVPWVSAFAQTDWRRLQASDLPARVRAVAGLPHTLDAQNCVTWGRWQVCFGNEPPVAKFRAHPTGMLGETGVPIIFLRVENFLCINPLVGKSECEMLLNTDGFGQSLCHITGKAVTFQIRCPTGLVLE